MFPQYPPIVKGNTISNLILVNYLEPKKKRGKFLPDKHTRAFVKEYNTRDVFLNVNCREKDEHRTFEELTCTIIHETTHNILAKHVDEVASAQLDNICNEKYAKKILNSLFEISETCFDFDGDFWLYQMEINN